MALNPQFAPQSTRKLQIAYGYVYGAGYNDLTTVALDGSQYKRFILGEGEWDGVEIPNVHGNPGSSTIVGFPAHLVHPPVLNDGYTSGTTIIGNPDKFINALGQALHFHSGSYTPIGTRIPTPDPVTGIIPPNSSQSIGADQGYDIWYQNFPTVMPPQSLSGIAYAIWGAPPTAGFTRGNYSAPTITGLAVWRSMRVRTFDAFGNVLSYGFTCNPAWHKVDVILRKKIRPNTPPVAGLTDAEKACFNWQSVVDLAGRNDLIGPAGNPMYVGNYIFAADATLANVLEVMCRVDRSYQRVDNGKIVLTGDEPRASVFIASAKHLIPDTLALDKRDVSRAANIFVPKYRDLDIPAVVKIISATGQGAFFLSGRVETGFRSFVGTTRSPFTNYSYMRYGGCSDPQWDGTYKVFVPDESNDPYPKGSAHPNTTYALMVTPAGTPVENVTGGYLGADDARFSERSPVGVQHRSAQKIRAAQAPGVAVQPNLIRVEYDCGNSTFDQTNRLMKFERDRQLGTDTGDSWKAPIDGTLSFYLEAVDANGVQLSKVLRTHNVITLDETLYPEAPGDYEIGDVTVIAPDVDSVGRVDLAVRAYNRNAYPVTSDNPGDYHMSVPNTGLKLGDFTPVRNAAWVLQSTLAVSGSGSTRTVAIPDLSMQIMGKVAPTAYPGFTVSGIPINTQVALYVRDPSGAGIGATYGFVLGSTLPLSTAGSGTGTPATLLNLLLNADFSQTFATIYNTFPNWTTFESSYFAPDTLDASTANGGEAIYTHWSGLPVSAPAGYGTYVLLSQNIPTADWTPGEYLMLSGSFMDTNAGTPNVGNVEARISFYDSSSTLISSAVATTPLDGTTPALTAIHTASTLIPAGTVRVKISFGIGDAGGGVGRTFEVGSRLTMAKLMVEKSTATQAAPSTWVVAAAPDGSMLVYTGMFT